VRIDPCRVSLKNFDKPGPRDVPVVAHGGVLSIFSFLQSMPICLILSLITDVAVTLRYQVFFVQGKESFDEEFAFSL